MHVFSLSKNESVVVGGEIVVRVVAIRDDIVEIGIERSDGPRADEAEESCALPHPMGKCERR